ncbi:hypothetical protein NC653_024182 [Populus alba x Populus x berolinensis]|uniref:Endonuclease/exonuclease/phosphatase domain-containing protein n=1 Tax=Populus alba x Populus x berolinensis TaxID=444605 RepID=A0AAD6Q7J5_9ROSI|nr:hypothetical protein NC653_024182 [Populus alba x Populus x berolinensis]
MDSLHTTSANSYAAHEVSAEASSSSIPHNPVQSSSPLPTTVRKKKGGSWNIWGLNGLQKQKTIHSWIQKHNLDIFGLLETKIAASNLADIETKLTPPHWKYFSNIASSPTCRILVGDKSGGDTSWPRHQDDFKNCITQSNLLQAPYTGLKYFWHNGQHGSQTIQKKLDWVFGNPQLFSTWPATHAIFQPRSISDHSAMLLNLQSPSQHPTSPFKFLNIWADRSDFIATVATSWQLPVYGNPIYQLTTKLRRLKIDLKMFHWQNTSNITGRVDNAKAKWDAAQLDLDRNPASETAKTIERTFAMHYQQLCKDEESYFKQKSRVQWLHLGDRNTSFFHKSLLHR